MCFLVTLFAFYCIHGSTKEHFNLIPVKKSQKKKSQSPYLMVNVKDGLKFQTLFELTSDLAEFLILTDSFLR
jgi:hypothetical protein